MDSKILQIIVSGAELGSNNKNNEKRRGETSFEAKKKYV